VERTSVDIPFISYLLLTSWSITALEVPLEGTGCRLDLGLADGESKALQNCDRHDVGYNRYKAPKRLFICNSGYT
jgi:hypothetical protein